MNRCDFHIVEFFNRFHPDPNDPHDLCDDEAEEFIAYVNNTGFNQEEMTAIASWEISYLWTNWHGACINNGSIWFRDVDTEKKEFKIVSLFDIREAGGEITD